MQGVASFTLKGGQHKTAAALPAGTGYTVTEADYSKEGYVTTSSGAAGIIALMVRRRRENKNL